MSYKGFKFSEESRIKMSESAKSKPPMTLEHKKKIGDASRGKKRPPFSDEWKANLKRSHIGINSGSKHPLWGKKVSDETKAKISKTETGKKMSEESKRKMSLSRKGDLNSNWRGGKSYEKYTEIWCDSFKNTIRERDNLICQECGIHQDELSNNLYKHLDVHHIDYDKHNCNPDNLISLCRQCHIKTNYNRESWISYFNNKTNE